MVGEEILVVAITKYHEAYEFRRHQTPNGATPASAAAGAAAMFLFDPARGRRRRRQLRDKTMHYVHRTSRAVAGTWRDVANRWAGTRARVRRILRETSPKLEQRVR